MSNIFLCYAKLPYNFEFVRFRQNWDIASLSRKVKPGLSRIDRREVLLILATSVTSRPEVSIFVTTVGRLAQEVLVFLPDVSVRVLVVGWLLEHTMNGVCHVVLVVVDEVVGLRWEEVHVGWSWRRWILLHGRLPLPLDVTCRKRQEIKYSQFFLERLSF